MRMLQRLLLSALATFLVAGTALAAEITHPCGALVPAPMPAAWTCREAFDGLAGPAVTEACFELADGRTTRCERRKVLVRLFDNNGASGQVSIAQMQQAALDIAAFYEDVSYGSLVLDMYLAGRLAPGGPMELLGRADAPLPAGANWYQHGANPVKMINTHTLDQLCNSILFAGLDDFDIFLNASAVNSDGASRPGVAARTNADTDCGVLSNKGFAITRVWTGGTTFGVNLSNHELGHTLGLDHAYSLSSINEDLRQYGDDSDTMADNVGHFRALTKAAKGWLPADFTRSLPALVGLAGWSKGTLDGLEGSEDRGLPKHLQIGLDLSLPSDQNAEFYSVEARRSDPGYRWSVTSGWNLNDGVIVRKVAPGEPTHTVDMSSESPNHNLADGALMPGRTFSDPDHGIHITVASTTMGVGGEAKVHVFRHSAPIVNAPPAPVGAGLTVAACDPAIPGSCPQTPHNASFGWTGDTAAFTAAYTDPDGDDLFYFWNFEVGDGDDYGLGDYADGTAVTHTFAADPRRVWLTVSDGKGGTATDFIDAPGYAAQAPVVLDVLGSRIKDYEYSFLAEVDDANGDLLFYDWLFQGTTLASGARPKHAFPGPGTYSVEVAVNDGDQADTMAVNFQVARSWEEYPACLATPPGRSASAMVGPTGTEYAVLFGGWNGLSAFGDTWVFSAGCWHQATNLGAVPSARYRHAMAWDAVNDVFVLFGGRDLAGNHFDDTYTMTLAWNGAAFEATWTLQAPVTSPSPRAHHAMVQAGPTGPVLLFGGRNGPALDDTWTWDGVDWTLEASGPSKRSNHGLVWDHFNQQVVLFGGADTLVMDQTWTWADGPGWVQAAPAQSPPARRGATVVYDARIRRVVVYGGEDDNNVLFGDVWEWDGSDWANMSPTAGATPGARRRAAGAYLDGDAERVVVFGGEDGFGQFHDDTWWLVP